MLILTDAPSKNTVIKGWVIDLANSLDVCIHFYLALETRNCFSEVTGSVESYRHIARETGGSVVGNAWEFSNFVASYKDSPCIYSPDVSPGKRSVSVDPC